MSKKPIDISKPCGSQGNICCCRPTFRQVVADGRVAAARRAWNRAEAASCLRHVAAAQGRRRAARVLADVKMTAIRRAMQLAPEHLTLGIDDEYQIGLPVIRWYGHRALHLPVSVAQGLPRWGRTSESELERQAS